MVTVYGTRELLGAGDPTWCFCLQNMHASPLNHLPALSPGVLTALPTLSGCEVKKPPQVCKNLSFKFSTHQSLGNFAIYKLIINKCTVLNIFMCKC